MSTDAEKCYLNLKYIYAYLKNTRNACSNGDLNGIINENDIKLLNENIRTVLRKYYIKNNNLAGGDENDVFFKNDNLPIGSTISRPIALSLDKPTLILDRNNVLSNKFLPTTVSFEMLLKKLFPDENCSAIETTPRIYDLFTDLRFKANDNSLIGEDETAVNRTSDIQIRMNVKNGYAKWKRPYELLGNKYNLFINTPQPTDVIQGNLGTCYFLSAIAALAEKPSRIMRLFEGFNDNCQMAFCKKYGIWGVKFFINGAWTTTVISDEFPYYVDDSGANPTQSVGVKINGELWPALLEKAWAKIYGTYAKIQAGVMSNYIYELTGAPTDGVVFYNVNLDGLNRMWNNYINAVQNNYIIVTSTPGSSNNPFLPNGLCSGHAYTVLTAFEVNFEGEQIRFIQLKNPHGHGEIIPNWNGKWSNKYEGWNNKYKRLLDEINNKVITVDRENNYGIQIAGGIPDLKYGVKIYDNNQNDTNDSVFLMEFSEYVKNFTKIAVCKINDGFKHTSMLSRSMKNARYFNIKIKTPGKYFISVVQASGKQFTLSGGDVDMSIKSILLAKINKDGYEYVEFQSEQRRDTYIELMNLEVGEYMAYVKITWLDKEAHDFMILTYGVDETEITHVYKNNKYYALDCKSNNLNFNNRDFIKANCDKIVVCDTCDDFLYDTLNDKINSIINERINQITCKNIDVLDYIKGEKIPGKCQFRYLVQFGRALSGHSANYDFIYLENNTDLEIRFDINVGPTSRYKIIKKENYPNGIEQKNGYNIKQQYGQNKTIVSCYDKKMTIILKKSTEIILLRGNKEDEDAFNVKSWDKKVQPDGASTIGIGAKYIENLKIQERNYELSFSYYYYYT